MGSNSTSRWASGDEHTSASSGASWEYEMEHAAFLVELHQITACHQKIEVREHANNWKSQWEKEKEAKKKKR